jgi:hypothetical protein
MNGWMDGWMNGWMQREGDAPIASSTSGMGVHTTCHAQEGPCEGRQILEMSMMVDDDRR